MTCNIKAGRCSGSMFYPPPMFLYLQLDWMRCMYVLRMIGMREYTYSFFAKGHYPGLLT